MSPAAPIKQASRHCKHLGGIASDREPLCWNVQPSLYAKASFNHVFPIGSLMPIGQPVICALLSHKIFLFTPSFALPYLLYWASQAAQVVKNWPTNAGDIRDTGSIPGLGRSPGEGHGNPCQYSCLENPIDRGAWWTTVHRVTKSQTQLKWLSMHIYYIVLKHVG